MPKVDEIKSEITRLHAEGAALTALLRGRNRTAEFEANYQHWYSKTLPLVKLIAPDRLAEFKGYYEIDPKARGLWTHIYVIQHYLKGIDPFVAERHDTRALARRCLVNQLAVFKSLESRVDWRLLDMEDGLRVELYAGELKTARSMIKVDARAAGALAHVVLTGHLQRLCRKHRAKVCRQQARPQDFGEVLRESGVMDAQVKAQVSWLGEIGERCVKEDEAIPTPFQVRDLVDGTDWVVKNVF